jgi:NAD(P)-dependent dehydrogenase (short-subunit alcohol dehydrogenase family)
MKKVLITGSSSGLGLSLCDTFLKNGYEVFGISRSKTEREITSSIVDFADKDRIKSTLSDLVKNHSFEYVILNAGTIEPIKKAVDLSLEEFERSFQINVGASKQILDFLFKNGNLVKNVIGISSGASNKPYDGWLNYCVTKSAFRQLISCYAIENEKSHFVSVAPGIIKTKMQDYILSKDATKFKSLLKFHNLYDTLEGPNEISEKIFDNLELFASLDSGSFVDLRNIV